MGCVIHIAYTIFPASHDWIRRRSAGYQVTSLVTHPSRFGCCSQRTAYPQNQSDTCTLVVSCNLGSFTHSGPLLAVSLCLVTVQPVEAGLAAQNNTGASGECSHPPFFLRTDFYIQTYIQSLQHQFSTFCGLWHERFPHFCVLPWQRRSLQLCARLT